jgi:hypothetical protein
MQTMKKFLTLIFFLASIASKSQTLLPLQISDNKRFFQTIDGKPFFWLGDTGWLLFKKLTREEIVQYLNDRKQKGFNVIQVMVLHELSATDVYGDSALTKLDISKPNTTPGNAFGKRGEYDYWDHIEFAIDEAAKRGIYMALVAVWGSNINDVSIEQVTKYATFLANRYRDKTNIIWINGGDIKGGDALDKWNAIGKTLRSVDTTHLITFHPRGRHSSSIWFHDQLWLDFNMFQSGHRTYAQDTLSDETLHYGEDNWRYVSDDYRLIPIKPTMDGEPSYEDIPQGLHNADQPYWKDYQIRRYAYWSVFAGGCGVTYGNNEVMQFFSPGQGKSSYFPKVSWQKGLQSPGAAQMKYLKELMLSKSYFDRVPDQSLVIDNGERYDHIVATRGKSYALFYIYNGRSFKADATKLPWKRSTAYWFNPRNGTKKKIYHELANKQQVFNPPGENREGNDWVLILETTDK